MIKNARKFDPKTKTISVEATPYTSMCTDVFNHLYGFCIGVIYCGLILLGLNDMMQFIII
ncbi:MAG: hypothetical protein MHPSP_003485, partial [Paramarteilia canceri]